jgi:uncharacterized protein
VLHAIWHIPLMVFAGDPPLVALIVVAGSVLNTWLFNNTKGSVLLTMLLHASVDVLTGVFGPMFAGAEAESQFMWETVVFVAMAIILAVLAGPELGRKPEPVLAAAAAEGPVALK